MMLVVLVGIYLNWRNTNLDVPEWIWVNFDRVVNSQKEINKAE